MKLFLVKDKTLENLLVIGYNPSHQNINSGNNNKIYIK